MSRLSINYPTRNLIGQKFNRWFVLDFNGMTKGKGGKSFSTWLCRCECGYEQVVRVDTLKRCKGCMSCGNKRKGEKMSLPEGEAAFNSLYLNNYKTRAKKNNIYFGLTKEHFKELTSSNCFYCGSPPKQVCHYPNQNGVYVYNGVDRFNNEEGYTFENSVPCCKSCNYMKKAKPLNEFLQEIKSIYDNMKEKGYYNEQ